MKTKICTKCKEEKELSDFHKHKLGKYGVDSVCKDCKSILQRKHHIKNKEEINQKARAYRKQNKQHVLKGEQQYRIKNKQKLRKYEKNWCIKNPDKVKLKAHKWYIKNKERINKEKREYYYKNKKRLNKKSAVYHKIRRNKDIKYKIKGNLRTRLSMALSGHSKSASTMFLIGCEIDFLLYHLQEQFTKGMTWDNYGRTGWEIDHIKPCALFDLSKSEEQRKCFHYTNLQPLWVEDNRKKSQRWLK